MNDRSALGKALDRGDFRLDRSNELQVQTARLPPIPALRFEEILLGCTSEWSLVTFETLAHFAPRARVGEILSVFLAAAIEILALSVGHGK